MAAEVLAQAGAQVDLYDAMPSVGRKFLLAGRGGLNLTHSEPLELFLGRYAERRGELAAMVEAFTPQDLRDWTEALGIGTFVGTSGRVFPTEMKAAPMLRAWLNRLRGLGVRFHMRHRWQGWAANGTGLHFTSPAGDTTVQADAVLLALGGASWARLGSDGAWVPWLQTRGADIAPLRAANCGFDVAPTASDRAGWSEHLSSRFAGQPIKPVALSFTGPDGELRTKQGEFVLTASGVEGSLIYAFSAAMREAIQAQGQATIHLDLLPAHTPEQVLAETRRPRGPRSLSTHLKSRLGIQGLKMALHEVLTPAQLQDPAELARALKALPITVTRPRPVDEAISTAGGVRFESLTPGLMLKAAPGVFCAGEMLDWEAPTGGYLLTACFATGRQAARGLLDWWSTGHGA